MKRITAGVFAALAGGSLLLTAGTANASVEHTHLRVLVKSVTPDPVAIEGDTETPVSIDVRTRGAVRVEVQVRPVAKQPRPLAAKESTFVRHGGLWRFTTSFGESDPGGPWLAIATAYDRHGKKLTDSIGFDVKHVPAKADTRIKRFDASPEAVWKGRTVHLSGKLSISDDQRWKGYADQKVGIYFRQYGTSEWKWVAGAETNRHGKFHADARATASGVYRAVYAGNDDANGTKSGTDGIHIISKHNR